MLVARKETTVDRVREKKAAGRTWHGWRTGDTVNGYEDATVVGEDGTKIGVEAGSTRTCDGGYARYGGASKGARIWGHTTISPPG